jgi:hypothetical protein
MAVSLSDNVEVEFEVVLSPDMDTGAGVDMLAMVWLLPDENPSEEEDVWEECMYEAKRYNRIQNNANKGCIKTNMAANNMTRPRPSCVVDKYCVVLTLNNMRANMPTIQIITATIPTLIMVTSFFVDTYCSAALLTTLRATMHPIQPINKPNIPHNMMMCIRYTNNQTKRNTYLRKTIQEKQKHAIYLVSYKKNKSTLYFS